MKMPSQPQLTAMQAAGVTRIKPGRYSDGRNLYLLVKGKESASWVFMWGVGGKRAEMGLGSFLGTGSLQRLSLKEARTKADTVRGQIVNGIDPRGPSKRKNLIRVGTGPVGAMPIFRDCMVAKIDLLAPSWKNSSRDKTRKHWESSMANHAKTILDLPVDAITVDHVEAILKPIWAKQRVGEVVLLRINAILDYAVGKGHVVANVARWKNNLDLLFPARDAKAKSHASMPAAEVPAFVARLRAKGCIRSNATLMAVMSGGRSNEVLNMQHSELDLDNGLWIIPAARMKADRDHAVVLSRQAVELLRSIPVVEGNPHVFAGRKAGQPINEKSMRDVMAEMKIENATPHGFRATFRTWARKNGYADDISEAAIAHAFGNAVTRVYQRDTALVDERVSLMQHWADHCFGHNVVPMKKVAA